jgi:RHS repeat-associated protein
LLNELLRGVITEQYTISAKPKGWKMSKTFSGLAFFLWLGAFASAQENVLVDEDKEPNHFDPRREIIELRDEHSKTYAGDDGYFYKVVRAVPWHYRTPEGGFRELAPHFAPINGSATDFAGAEGLYRCSIRKTGPARAAIRFEIKGGQFFELTPVAMGYFDPIARRVALLDSARLENPIVAENRLTFLEIFPEVDVQYLFEAGRFKEEIRLRQSFRDSLPDPRRYGMKDDRAHLVFLAKVILDTTLSAFAEGIKISHGRMPGRFPILQYEGKSRIAFKTPNGRALFYMPEDFAFYGSGQPPAEPEMVLRSFFPSGPDLIMMAGITYSWLMRQPPRPIIIDPHWVITSPNQDASIRYQGSDFNGNGSQLSIAGGQIGTVWSSYRTLLKFDLSGINLPDTARIADATCHLYLSQMGFYGGNTSTIYQRPVQVHELLRSWNEAQVNWFQAQNGVNWTEAGVGLNGQDARAVPVDTRELPTTTSTWVPFNLTSLAKKWIANPASNYGVLFWAVNEVAFPDGQEYIFPSRESGSLAPQLIIKYQYSEIARYTYNGDGSLASVQLGSDVISGAYTYNDSGLVKKIDFTTQGASGANTVFKEEIAQYDAVGNIKRIKTTSPLGTEISTYTYDSISRLDSANSSAYNDMGFRYDRNGNLTKKFVNGTLYSYSYSNPKINNRLNSFNNTSFTYDAIGNVISYGNKTMTYDHRRQIETVIGPVAEYYDYNADNWRVKKTEGLVRRGTVTWGNIDEWRLDVTGAIENATPLAGSTMYRLEVKTNAFAGNHRTDDVVKIATGLSIPVTSSSFLAYSIQAKQAGDMRASIQLKFSDGSFTWNTNFYDQNGVSNIWSTDLNSRFVGQWYTRVVSLSAFTNKTITEVVFHTNDNPDITTGVPTTFVFYADEIRINGIDVGEVNGNTGTTTPGYYLEDFNDQNINDGRPTAWQQDSTNHWNATAGTLNAINYTRARAVNADYKFSNFTAEFDVKATGYWHDGVYNQLWWAGFGFRRASTTTWWENDGYLFYYTYNGQINLYRDSVIVATANTGKDLTARRHVKIEAQGSSIKVYIDYAATPQLILTDGMFTTGTACFFSNGVTAKFDNLTISSFGDQQRTYYIYSGDVPIAEYDANGNLLAEYVYANGQLVAKLNPDSTTHYYLTDHLGSPRILYGTNWNANYYAYGEVAAQSGSDADNKYTFTGKECDCSTGLRYYGWRYYDPVIGRWLTLDPIGQDWSPYAYAGNNPLVYVDPDGRVWFVPILIGAAIGGTIGGVYAHNHGGEWWQGALAGAVVGGTWGYFAGAVGGATPLLGSTTANWAIAGAGIGTGLGMLQAGAGVTSWDNIWKYGFTGALTGATIGLGSEIGMFSNSQSTIYANLSGWGKMGASTLFWGGAYASLGSMAGVNGSTRQYWNALGEGAQAGGISGAASVGFVQLTNAPFGAEAGRWIRTGLYALGNINTVSQTFDFEHSLFGAVDVLASFAPKYDMPFLHDLGSILFLDDVFQTTPTKILRYGNRGRESGYGSPVNNYYRSYLCKRLRLPNCRR